MWTLPPRVQIPNNTKTIQDRDLHNYYPKTEYLIIGPFGPLGLPKDHRFRHDGVSEHRACAVFPGVDVWSRPGKHDEWCLKGYTLWFGVITYLLCRAWTCRKSANHRRSQLGCVIVLRAPAAHEIMGCLVYRTIWTLKSCPKSWWRNQAPDATTSTTATLINTTRLWSNKSTGLLSNRGEKSINVYFIIVPLRKKY